MISPGGPVLDRLARDRVRTTWGWWGNQPPGLLRRVATRSDLLADLWGELWAVLLLAVVIAGILARQPLVVALGAMATVVAVGARAWARLSLEEVDFARELSSDRVFAGEELDLSFSVVNKKPLPLPWLRLVDAIPVELRVESAGLAMEERTDARILTRTVSIGWYERVRLRYRVKAERRGYLVFGPARLESGDLFGLFRSSRDFNPRDAVIVYPRTVPLPDFEIPSPRPIGDARSRIRLWEDTTRPAGLREYMTGDSMRRVDWKASARRADLLVRTYDHRVAQAVVIAVDVDTSEKPWEGYSPQMLERVVTAAASVAVHAVDLGHRIGLISNAIPLSEDARMVIPPGADPARLSTILESLAMVRPISMSRLDRVLDAERTSIPFGATIVAVSAVFPALLAAECAELARHGHPTVALYVGEDVPPSATPGMTVLNAGQRFDLPENRKASDGRHGRQ
ncbi:MAG: DUF58 domain-containing protein [Chloroflexi bacterium]|nr:DUF58 domain-containing protein [Chloroflexota bacterium]